MLRVAGVSKLLVDILLPACLWGMISALMLVLIEIRSEFLMGGESRLRLAVIAFSGGVVLIQRLASTQGPTVARTYSLVFGGVMFLFAGVYSYQIKFPIHGGLAFAIHAAIFGVLWWVGHQMASACSSTSDFNQAAASEGGSLPRLNLRRFINVEDRKKEIERVEAETDKKLEVKWKDRLSRTHPGRVILYFSLFVIPVFGIARFILSEETQLERNIGGLLFIYLWCALSLLFLSSLGQLAAYFKSRKVSLPETVAGAWLAIGLAIVTATLTLGFMLPGPASPATDQVRAQIKAVYQGREGERGFNDRVGSEPKAGEGEKRDDAGKAGPDAKDKGKGGSGEKDARAKQKGEGGNKKKKQRQTREATDIIAKTFKGMVSVMLVLGAVAGVFALLFGLVALWGGLASSLDKMKLKSKPKKTKTKKEKKKKAKDPWAAKPAGMPDPFGQPGLASDGDALVRYLWEAMLAWCDQEGETCGADIAAMEFVEGDPESLKGFEEKARYIAGLVNFSEYSEEAIGQDEIPRLKQFWTDLQGHMREAGTG